jgi:SOS response regulatory protein OraA/RecX
MATNEHEQQEAVNQMYNHAANLLIHEKRGPDEVKNLLMQKGLDAEGANVVVENLENQIQAAKKSRAQKDMLYGAL